MISVTRLQLIAIFVGAGLFWLVFSSIYYALGVPDKLFPRQPTNTPTSQASLRQVAEPKTARPTPQVTVTPTFTPTRVPTATPSPTPTPTPVPPTATPTATTPPAPASYSYQGFTVPARGIHRFPVTLRSGSKMEGYFQDARGNDITFWIEDPLGKTVDKAETVSGRVSFALTAGETGVYNLVFKNNDKIFGRTMGLWWRVL